MRLRITVSLTTGEKLKFNNVSFYDLDFSDTRIKITQISPMNIAASTYISKEHIVAITISD